MFFLIVLMAGACSSHSPWHKRKRIAYKPNYLEHKSSKPKSAIPSAQRQKPAGRTMSMLSQFQGSIILPAIIHAQDQSEMVLVNASLLNKKNIIASTIDTDRKPQTVSAPLPIFYIDRNEVTVEKYKQFDPAYRETPYSDKQPCPKCPAMAIDWQNALNYCLWAGKTLPTEVQWVAAALGSEPNDWPWGSQFLPQFANLTGQEDGFQSVANVSSFPQGVSSNGALDMIGNVWEWVDTEGDTSLSPKTSVVKGGGWRSHPKEARISFRNIVPKLLNSPTFGFRCAKPGPLREE